MNMVTNSKNNVYSIDMITFKDKYFMCVTGDSKTLDIFEIKDGKLPKSNIRLTVEHNLILLDSCKRPLYYFFYRKFR